MTDPDGDAAAHDMELVDEVIDQLKEGLKKLKPELQGPHDKRDPLFEGDEYVWDAGIIGSTAWYRKLHRPAQESVHEFLCKIKEEIESFALDLNVNIDLKIELISEHQEAMYEQRAVEYACARMGLPLPAATISAGSGSMQFSSTPLNLVASIQMSLAEGEDLVKQENDRAWKQRVKVSFDACEEVHAKYVNYHSTYSSAVKLAAGTLNQRSPTKQATSPLLRSGSSAAEFYLVGISGLYYAAKAAKNADGVPLTKAHNGEYINVVEVLQAFEVLEANVNETPKNRANAMRVRVVLNAFLELTGLTGFYANYAKIMFLRDVRTPPFDERSPFRTTWTSGWWIERLKSHGVSLGTK